MSSQAVVIPEKLFFKIGEVCELVGVQAHVLRYWESEFSMLAPQKNRAGQRVYRKRDVEMALKIKELLYEDQYTIAGAKKRLSSDLRGGGKVKTSAGGSAEGYSATEHPHGPRTAKASGATGTLSSKTDADRKALRRLASELRELLSLLEKGNKPSSSSKK